MGKSKKKNRTNNDTRGYSVQSISSSASQVSLHSSSGPSTRALYGVSSTRTNDIRTSQGIKCGSSFTASNSTTTAGSTQIVSSNNVINGNNGAIDTIKITRFTQDILDNLIRLLQGQQEQQQQQKQTPKTPGATHNHLNHTASTTKSNNDISSMKSNPRFIKRIGKILDRFLLEYNFTLEQIKWMVASSSKSSMDGVSVGAVADFTDDESIMDWLCFNIPNSELPPMFRDDGPTTLQGGTVTPTTTLEVLLPKPAKLSSSANTNDTTLTSKGNDALLTSKSRLANAPTSKGFKGYDGSKFNSNKSDQVQAGPTTTSNKTNTNKSTKANLRTNHAMEPHILNTILPDDKMARLSQENSERRENEEARNKNQAPVRSNHNIFMNDPAAMASVVNTPLPSQLVAKMMEIKDTKTDSGDVRVTVTTDYDEDDKLLEQLRTKLKEVEADLSNEANNYMRSKYEVKEMQLLVKQLRQQVQGLERKIKKKKEKIQHPLPQRVLLVDSEVKNNLTLQTHGQTGRKQEEGRNLVQNSTQFNDDNGDDVGYDGMSSLFEVNHDETGTNTEGVTGETTNDEDDDKFVDIPIDSIPKSWTGKTPLVLLEDFCRKDKLSRPNFTTYKTNGCELKIYKQSSMAGGNNKSNNNNGSNNDRPLVVETIVLSQKYSNSQHYAATVALYQLHPDLPLYRMLPPFYKDTWMSWLHHEKTKHVTKVQELTDQRMELIREVIACIPSTSTTTNSSSKKITQTKGATNRDNMRKETMSVNRIDESMADWNHEKHNNETPLTKVLVSQRLSQKDYIDFQRRQSSSKYQEMLSIRMSLPIYSFREQILQTIQKYPVTIIQAETGSGKTTQCSSFILEQALDSKDTENVSILCTQPRRVATISVAERVAEELAEDGSAVGGLVGYQIRLESKRSSRTKLLFCTTGVALRRLMDDPSLSGITHVVVDECHERQWQIDCLLVTLRTLIESHRPDLKVILMSATLDTALFSSFYKGAPIVSIPGRTFPVTTYYLEDAIEQTGHVIEENSKYSKRDYSNRETVSILVSTRAGEKRQETADIDLSHGSVSDMFPGYSYSTRRTMDRVDETVLNYDLIEDILTLLFVDEKSVFLPPKSDSSLCNDSSINNNGSVLIFLQGIGEIRQLSDRLAGSRNFGNTRRFDIIPLHSTLSSNDQRRAFLSSPKGCRKIILSTNIAETSVTIPDVVYVIDSGRVREVQRDKRTGTRKLVSTWCARANAKQRAGRAGRVRVGVCIKLYSSVTENEVMKKECEPELKRIPLEEVCLTILASGFTKNCANFLSQTPQPPSDDSVRSALQVLVDIGAVSILDNVQSITNQQMQMEQVLTPLGQHLAKLPVDAKVGKMLILGAVFRCINSILTIAAALSATKSLFGASLNDTQLAKAAHAAFAHPTSDFITILNVWNAFCQASGTQRQRKFCNESYLNYSALIEIRDLRFHYLELLVGLGFLDKESLGYDSSRQSYDDTKIEASIFNSHGSKEDIVHAVVCAGLYPNVARITKSRLANDSNVEVWNKNERLYIRDSVNTKVSSAPPFNWIVYFDKMGTERRVSVSTTAFVSPFCLMMFGSKMKILHTERKVRIDDWIEIVVSAKTAAIFQEIRTQLNSLFKFVFENCHGNRKTETNYTDIIEAIVKLLSIN